MSTLSHRRSLTLAFALAATAALGLGLGGSSPVRADDHARPVAFATGAEVFAQNCVTCHGPKGDGDGPAAAGLNPKPRKLSDKAVMSKLSDEQIATVIKKGGPAVGKSPLMPPWAQFDDATVKGLVAHIRSLCGCSFSK